ncbi:MAG: tetratricopeptide (TPR) repeat protein [Nonlabens sp.]
MISIWSSVGRILLIFILYLYLGLCGYKLGNYEPSNVKFSRPLNESEFITQGYFGMAKVYKKLGEFDKAKENMETSEELIGSKREEIHNEFLNEIYLSKVVEFKKHFN